MSLQTSFQTADKILELKYITAVYSSKYYAAPLRFFTFL
jgi:hypothetical protein